VFAKATPRALCVSCQVVRTRRHCKNCPWIYCVRCKVKIHPRTLNVIEESEGEHD